MPMPKIKHVRAFVVRGGGADYHDQGDGHWIDDHIATPMARYPEYRAEPPELRHQRARHAGGRDRGRQRRHRLRGDHRRRDRRLHRREPPRALHRRASRHRHREDLGPDVQRHAVLRAQGHRDQRHLRRRPRALGPARQDPPGAGAPTARRRRARRACSSTPPARARISHKKMGFIGGKLPLHHGPAEGEEGLRKNLEAARRHARARRPRTSG